MKGKKMKAWQLLDSPEKWTQGVFARDKHGWECDWRSEEAVRWCVKGALNCCYLKVGDSASEYCRILDKIYGHLKENDPEFTSLTDWQDSPQRKFEEIRSVLQELDV
jgi:hypothetical protein